MFVRLFAAMAVGLLACDLGAALSAHAGSPAPARSASLEALLAKYRRPAEAPSPTDNPTTAAKADLGRQLFYDPRLSGSGVISCASCHDPALGWADGRATAIGDHGARLPRRTPTLVDVAWVEPLFWDGRVDTLEAQARGPLANAHEMNMPSDRAIERVSALPGYVSAFRATFGAAPITIDTITKAIAAFERTVVSGTAPFDRWVAGDDAAISEPAKRGFVLFNGKADCASCHSGWRLTDDGFRDIGLASVDPGRGGIVPGIAILDHAFKTPTLRNVAGRGPYMHDGSIPTLKAVIDHYDHGFVVRPSLAAQIKPLHLSTDEKADLVAYLRTLSSDDCCAAAPVLPQ